MSDRTRADAPPPGLAEASRLQRDLYLYWLAVAREGSVSLTSRGYVARPALRRLRMALHVGETNSALESGASREAEDDATESDLPRLLFIRRALERLGLLHARGVGERGERGETSEAMQANETTRLEAAETRAMARYLARPLAERSRLLTRLWLGGAWWPDQLDPRAGLPGLLTPAAPRVAIARRRLIEEIAALAPGEALPAPQAWRPPRAAAPRHGRAGRRRITDRPLAHVTHMTRPQSAASGDDVAPAALAGPLSWLGAVTWDEEAGEWRVGLPGEALREAAREGGANVGPDAAAPETPGSSTLVERHGRVAAQSDLSVIAYPPFSAPELLTLDLCASREALSQTARYRLTRAALANARDFGWDAAEVARRLERLIGEGAQTQRATHKALPGSVRVKLGDWERLASRLRLEQGVALLEAPTPETLDALLADRASANWGVRRLTATAASIAPEAAPQVRAWLLRHGLLPALRDPDADDEPSAEGGESPRTQLPGARG